MKKIQSKMKELEWSQHYSLIFKMLKGANSKMCDGILTKFKLIQALIVVLIVCNNEEDPFKLKALESSQDFSHYKPMKIFFKRTRAGNSKVPGWILPNFEPIRNIMGVLVACKNEEDPIKNEGSRVVTTIFIDSSHAQEQLTPKLVMKSCRNSSPSKPL